MTLPPSPYDAQFYADQAQASARSAAKVLPLLLRYITPSSALDVGCGTGSWAVALRRLTNCHVTGLDGEHVPAAHRLLDADSFIETDLTIPLPQLPVVDLVICLEVAEHLAADRAESFIAELARQGRAVLFSAALPWQGGTHHVNENWLEYWALMFARHGLEARDVLRPILWNDLDVCWWYRQNLMLFVREGQLGSAPFTDALPSGRQTRHPLSMIHPIHHILAHASPGYGHNAVPRRDLPYFSRLLQSYLDGAMELPSDILPPGPG